MNCPAMSRGEFRELGNREKSGSLIGWREEYSDFIGSARSCEPGEVLEMVE